MTQRRLAAVLCLVSLLAVAGCSSFSAIKKDGEVENHEAVEVIYNRAAAKLDAGEYSDAAKFFDEVEQNYPYSQWATRAQLMAGYAHYKNLRYDDAILALDRFIELHPGDENSPYAYYLKALCYYEQISDVRRDQHVTELSLEALRQVKSRFPDSQYAKDASLKIDLTLDHLAGKEMEIGRYYLDRRQFQAAINRFEKVVEQYQTTSHVPEALHRLTEAYVSLGLRDEAQKTAAILGQNYPQSVWYKDTYKLVGPNAPTAATDKKWYDMNMKVNLPKFGFEKLNFMNRGKADAPATATPPAETAAPSMPEPEPAGARHEDAAVPAAERQNNSTLNR